MNMSIRKYVLLICAMAVSLPAFSAKMPDYYPEVFDRWGVIGQIDLDNQIIVMNDVNIHVARDLQVHTMNTRFATSQSLKPGIKIGFGTTGSRATTGAVTEIWILPADYTPPRNENSPEHDRRKDRD